MKQKIIAIIDIGSNSVRILIAEVSKNNIKPIYKDINTTRLYQDISADYILAEISMIRTISAIKEFVAFARENISDEIYLFATAAVRVAKNKDVFVSKVKGVTNLQVEIIAEEKEAYLAYEGVGCDLRCGVIDIGGASTEIVIGDNGRVLSCSSAKVGAVKCKEILADESDTEKIVSYASSILIATSKDTIAFAKEHNKLKWHGVGGTITTMAAMQLEMEIYDSEKINQTAITYKSIIKMLNRIKSIDISKRHEIKGLQSKRADIIIYGLGILISVMDECSIETIHASDNDNLVGFIRLKMKEKEYDNAYSNVEV